MTLQNWSAEGRGAGGSQHEASAWPVSAPRKQQEPSSHAGLTHPSPVDMLMGVLFLTSRINLNDVYLCPTEDKGC